MRVGHIVFSILAVWLTVGCSSTRVVLVPDAEGHVGEVAVATDTGEQVLNEAGESTKVTSAKVPPGPPETLSTEEIGRIFGEAIANEPLPPVRYRVHFQFDSITLKPDSGPILHRVVDEARSRPYCDVSVIGHADRAGDAGLNKRLSLRRANSVEKALIGLGLPADCLEIRYFGESDPVVRTPDGVAEPRNRRVEIEIR